MQEKTNMSEQKDRICIVDKDDYKAFVHINQDSHDSLKQNEIQTCIDYMYYVSEFINFDGTFYGCSIMFNHVILN